MCPLAQAMLMTNTVTCCCGAPQTIYRYHPSLNRKM